MTKLTEAPGVVVEGHMEMDDVWAQVLPTLVNIMLIHLPNSITRLWDGRLGEQKPAYINNIKQTETAV